MITKCRKHYRYRARRKPRCTCEDCWRYWFYRQSTLEDLQHMEHQKIMENHHMTALNRMCTAMAQGNPWARMIDREALLKEKARHR